MHLVMSQPPPIPYSVTHALALAAAHNYDLHTRIFRDLTAEVPHLEQDVMGLAEPTLIVWGEEASVLAASCAAILPRSLPIPHIGMVILDQRAIGKGCVSTWRIGRSR